jgi:pyruvate dehydrogenase (quinone)
VSKTTADLLVERLIDWDVDTVFGFPGDGVNGIFEALRTHQEQIRFIQVRHEEAAAFAACGYAKYTGRLGVCLATSGPGGIHLMNGLYDATFDGQPVLAITGHTFHDLIGTEYQQDVDLEKVFSDVAVYSERVMGPEHMINVLDFAVKAALEQRGVACITIPKDIQDLSHEERSKANVPDHSGDLYAGRHTAATSTELHKAADLINAGTKVAILAGRGCLNARNEILQLAEAAGAPIAKALLGKAVVPDDSPYTTGGLGLLGTAPSQDALAECDTFIIAGSNFPYMEFLPKPGEANTIQIDIDPKRIGHRHPVEAGLVGDCKTILQALLPLIEYKEDRNFLETTQKRMKHWNELMEEQGTVDSMPMKPQVAVYHLNKYLADDAVVASDCGTVTTWAARYVQIRGAMKFSASGLLATMANGLPYAVGAAAAFPDRQVVAICGDGGFTMLMGEIATMVKYHFPVKVLIIKNNLLGEIKWEQLAMEGNPQYGVELQPIDFAEYARACGATGFCLDKAANAEAVMQEAFNTPGPVVIEAVVDPNEPPLPGKISTDQAIKFAEALVRGEPGRFAIIKDVVMDKVREVV